MQTTWTLGELAKQLQLSRATIRNWSGDAGEFADYLSPAARPPKGAVRVFNAADLQVLWFVQQCRRQGMGYDAIHPLLLNEEHLLADVVLEPAPPLADDPEPSKAQLQGQIQALTQERDWLREELGRIQTALIAAERRAAELEVRLQLRDPPEG